MALNLHVNLKNKKFEISAMKLNRILFFNLGIILFTQLLLFSPVNAFAQEQRRGYEVGYKIEDGDTVYQIRIRDTYLFNWPDSKRRGREWREFSRLVYNFRMAYPYALMAKEKVLVADSVLASRKFTSKGREKFIKDFEKQLFAEFEKPLRKMTISQGKLLLKLIDREIGQSSYQLIKEYKGGFNAVFWQGIARLFGSDLRKPYDKFGEDRITEDLVQMYNNGTFDYLFYSIF